MTAPRRALIVVDVQQEYENGPLQIQYPPREESVANTIAAINAAQAAGMPIVIVSHTFPEQAPVFAAGSEGWQLQPAIAAAAPDDAKYVEKNFASTFAGTDVAQWLAERNVDTITIVGFMTNNCDLATAIEAEGLGLQAEILSDASGAIHLANEAGSVTAEQLHTTLMVMLQSNFAAVATTADWLVALKDGTPLVKNNLVTSALAGRGAAV